jgi:magnesium-transporting ATPase (P-type)
VGVFQEYHDTVLSIGLAHLYQNGSTFSVADLSIGIDVLSEEITSAQDIQNMTTLGDTLSLDEVAFVNSLAAHSCLFILKGSHSISNIPEIIAYSRASLEASISSALFIMHACITLSLYILFCPCSISTAIPYVPIMGSAFYILIILPLLGLTMAMSSPNEDSMTRVPPKNDESKTFTRKEGQRLAIHSLAKAILPAAFPQVLYLVAFGSLIVENEPDLVENYCDSAPSWASVIRCDALRGYSDTARTSAGTLAFGCMVVCTIFASASFLCGTKPLWDEPPWRRNRSWRNGVGISIFLLGIYLLAALERGTFAALPWYFFCLSVVLPFLCLYCCEVIKRIDRRHENRAVMLRRLQFETRYVLIRFAFVIEK